MFENYVKYPRTPHLLWSEGVTSDDRLIEDLSVLKACEVVVTEKLDGENTTLYNTGLHARSLTYVSHISRNAMKVQWAKICGDIPEGMRICGENLYATHSIHYTELPSYFSVFGIYLNDTTLSWDETVEWCELLGLTVVPLLYRGMWDEKLIKGLYTGKSMCGGAQEGYVVRNANRFSFNEFDKNVAKFVRKNHVTTSRHWMHDICVPNELKR